MHESEGMKERKWILHFSNFFSTLITIKIIEINDLIGDKKMLESVTR